MSERIRLPLRNITVASPCPANWSDMDGDDRKRFCHQCEKHVYNFEGLTTEEIHGLLAAGDVCGRFFRRPDGTILTADCPVGIRIRRRRLRRYARRAAMLVLSVGFAAAHALGSLDPTGRAFTTTPAMAALQRWIGEIAPEYDYMIGSILLPVD